MVIDVGSILGVVKSLVALGVIVLIGVVAFKSTSGKGGKGGGNNSSSNNNTTSSGS